VRITDRNLRKLIREELQALHPLVAAAQDASRVKTTDREKKLYHRSNNPNLTVGQVSASSLRTSKQSRGGKTSGFYTYEDPTAGAKFGSSVLELILPAGTRYLDSLGTGINTSRISHETSETLRAMGIEAILGRDYVGPPEWIIISDDILRVSS